MRARVIACALLGLASCEGASAPSDAGNDAPDAYVTPVEFTAAPDPMERSDCVATIAPGTVVAKHITCSTELIDAPLAMGRLGDVLIASQQARFIIRTGTESASTIGGFAGGLVDASRDGIDDAIKEIFPLFDFGVARASDVVVTDAGADGTAVVTVLFDVQPLGILAAAAPGLSRARPVRGAIEYRLAAGSSVLEITTRYSTTPGTSDVSITPGLAALLGGNGELQRPGFGLIPGGGGGTGIPAVVSETPISALAIAMDDPSGTLLAINTIHLISGQRVGVSAGAVTTTRARIAVALTAADAWTLADPVTEPLLHVVAIGSDRLRIATPAGDYLRTRVSGDVRVTLPSASYSLQTGFGSFFGGPITNEMVPNAVADLDPPPRADVRVAATTDGDPTAPVRVTVRDAASMNEVIRFVAIGTGVASVPPGSYVVDVSHGTEFDIHEESITLAAGDVRTITAILDRAIDTTGYIGCDFHLHSDLSTDSLHHVVDAVRTIAAEGLELVASTDHDYITDYAAILARESLTDRVVVVPGDEVSSTVLGHFGGYPLSRDTAMAGAGAPIWFDRSPADIFDLIRARGDTMLGGAIVQINHPRLRGTSFFDQIALDDATGHATASPSRLALPVTTNLDDLSAVDVIEAWNGYTRGDNEAAFTDFLALWDTGRRFTMVGNSDSHLATLPAGAPRTYLRVANDAPGMFGWSDAATALHAHDATVAAGIFITATLAGAQSGGSVPLHVRVQAAPWASTNRLRVYAGRSVVVDMPLTTGANVRFDQTITVPLGGATWVLARADGDVDAEPVFPFHPFGVTNPIVVP